MSAVELLAHCLELAERDMESARDDVAFGLQVGIRSDFLKLAGHRLTLRQTILEAVRAAHARAEAGLEDEFWREHRPETDPGRRNTPRDQPPAA